MVWVLRMKKKKKVVVVELEWGLVGDVKCDSKVF